MRGHETKVIGGCTYTVTQMQPSTAIDVFADLTKMLAPAIAGALEGAGKVNLGSMLEMDTGALPGELLAKATTALAQNIDPAATKRILAALRKVTLVDGKQLDVIFEAHFVGRLKDLFLWAAFAVQVQFGDFFDAAPPSPDSGAAPGRA